MLHHHPLREVGPRPTNLLISADTANVNLFTLAGSPATAVTVTITIASGITVYSTSTVTPSFDWGTGWVTGSVLKLINNGNIVGAGGGGANGTANGATFPSDGGPGGDAMRLGNIDVSIDNTYGSIFGGGSGGRGGKGIDYLSGTLHDGGGGGGGGQGRNGGGGGTKGDANAQNGGSGTQQAAGRGGGGGTQDGGIHRGGAGHDGGSWGNGKAINLNTHIVTWLGGNNLSQVVGAVA